MTDLDGVLAAVAALVARVTAVSAGPDLAEVIAVPVIVAAFVLLAPAWPTLKHGVTIVHEAGHGFAALLAGRRLRGIRLHSDTSGLTVSVGRPRGPGMVLTLLAGYPAPSLLGLALAGAVASGHAAAALWGALVLLAGVLVQIRNWFGLWTVLVSAAIVGAVTVFADTSWQRRAALALASLLLLGGLRAAVELPAAGGRRGRSDADQLAALTRLPVAVWLALFVLVGVVVTVAAAVVVAGSLR